MKQILELQCCSMKCWNMASLVADYGDDSDDSAGEDSSSEAVIAVKEEVSNSKQEGVNFFADEGGASSDDSDTDEDGKKNSNGNEHAPPEPQAPKLPTPFGKLPAPHLQSADKKVAVSLPSAFLPGGTSSVFVNPFEQAEQAKLGILEKHVRLTEAAPTKPASKQVCFKFKKGKCHLGDKCRFFHDRSNIALGGGGGGGSVNAETDQDSGQGFGFGRGDSTFQFPGHSGGGGGGGGGGGVGGGQFYHPVAHYSSGQPADPNPRDDEDNYMSSGKRKKRYGVTDTLEPPKKALTDLSQQRVRERPWTAHKKK